MSSEKIDIPIAELTKRFSSVYDFWFYLQKKSKLYYPNALIIFEL